MRSNSEMRLNSSRPSIAILMPMVWGVRNVIHSGVLEYLVSAGADVHLLMRHYDRSLLQNPAHAGFAVAASCQSLVLPPVKRRIKGRAFFRDVVHSAFSKRNKIGSYVIYQRWFERVQTPAQLLRRRLVELLGTLAQPAPVFSTLYQTYDALYRLEYDLQPVREQLHELDPDLLWSTVNIESSFERAYVLAARALHIPVANSILSFDNLTSKPAHLLYDYYLVWNQKMKDQLLRFYPQVSPQHVTITGTPQFDFHCRPELRWSRRATLQRGCLPSDARYFLYACSTQALTPAEPALVAALAQRMRRDNALRDYWLVVRTHPRDDWSRWNSISSSSDRVVLSPAWDALPDGEGWALPTLQDQARFVSTLVHAEACLNIASTTALDAAILDRPVIGIRFEHEPDAPREILYEEYDADHYRPLLQSGGLRVARSWPELMALMRQAIRGPEQDREARARMVAQECGTVDGRAAERVANALLDCLAKCRRPHLYDAERVQ
jgi:hypothetical protein